MSLLTLFANQSNTSAPTAGGASFAQMNTTFTNDMGPDGFNWAQGGMTGPICIDQYGKIITLSEDSGGNHAITYSNDNGATWADGPSIGFIERGSLAYNSIDDRIEVLWLAQDPTDGMLYRYYTPTRNSNNITGWTAGGSGYCVLDAQSGSNVMTYMHPAIAWLSDIGSHGTVVCMWTARNDLAGSVGNEVRAVMRNLSGNTNDLTNTNWTHIGTNSTTSIANAPSSTSYTAIRANTSTNAMRCSFFRKVSGTHAKDLYVVWSSGQSVSLNRYQFRRCVWAAGSSNWTGFGTTTDITLVQRAGTDTGYSGKHDLISKPVEDTVNDCVYVGLATWASNAAGDTWGFAKIDSADAITLVDVYSASAAHSYAPTGDISWCPSKQRLVVTYIKQTSQAIGVQVFNGVTQSQAEQVVFSTAPFDIPLVLADDSITGFPAGKILLLGRDTNATKKGWFGTLTWS